MNTKTTHAVLLSLSDSGRAAGSDHHQTILADPVMSLIADKVRCSILRLGTFNGVVKHRIDGSAICANGWGGLPVVHRSWHLPNHQAGADMEKSGHQRLDRR
jgi:hypothetical protein